MAGTTSSAGGRRGGIVGINVTPMVDVMLVLLVIIMVSASWIASQSIKVDLPNTQTSDGSQQSLAAVTIDKSGAFFFNDKPVVESALISAFKEGVRKDKALTLIVTADKEAHHGAVMHVMDLARAEGITSFAVQVERKAE